MKQFYVIFMSIKNNAIELFSRTASAEEAKGPAEIGPRAGHAGKGDLQGGRRPPLCRLQACKLQQEAERLRAEAEAALMPRSVILPKKLRQMHCASSSAQAGNMG